MTTKKIIGAIVGGVFIFVWQFFSWSVIDLHRPQQMYTPNQDTILQFLDDQLAADGAFYLPTVPESAGAEEANQLYQKNIGKPWAQVFFHKQMKDNMLRNILRGLLINIVTIWLFVWVVGKISNSSFLTVLLAALATGLIVFFNESYTNHIWFETFDLNASFTDALISWGITGLWLGWWLNRKEKY